MIRGWLAGIWLMVIQGCATLPDGIDPVEGFDAERYLGTWYEIARLDHRFERGLTQVSAEYSRRDDGGLRVVNRGYKAADDEWSEAVGKARFGGSADTGWLEVAFFGPFYGSYVIFALDDDYEQAWVTGNDRDYLWFLSRTPTVDAADYERFVERARALGFETGGLIRVEQGIDPADRPLAVAD